MNFKAVFFLIFIVLATLHIVYGKPSPVFENPKLRYPNDHDEGIDQTIEVNEEAIEAQGEDKPRELLQESELLKMSYRSECPWPPALCPDGGMHGIYACASSTWLSGEVDLGAQG